MNPFNWAQNVDWTNAVTIIISLFALLVSAVALWKTTFSKFNAIFSVGNLRLRIYPIRNGKESWFIASVDLPLSIANNGAKPGIVSDIRIRVHYPKLPIPNHWEIFSPKWDIDSTKFMQSDLKDRFRWIEDAVLSEWMPLIVLSKQTTSKHLVRVLKKDGRFLLADIGKQDELFWKIKFALDFESLFSATKEYMKDNFAGRIPVFVGEAGFIVKEITPKHRGVQFLLCKKS